MTTQQYSKQVGVTPGSGVTDINGQIGPSINIAIDDIGTDVNITPGVPNPNDITINVPIASSTQTGKLTNTDWTTFNNKVDGPVASVDGEIALYNGITGDIKRATGSGVVTATNGVYGTVAPGASGNVLTSNGTSWVSQAPSTLSNTEAFSISSILGPQNHGCYSDDFSYWGFTDASTFYFTSVQGFPYRRSTNSQQIDFASFPTPIIAPLGGIMIYGGYVYVCEKGSNNIQRCLVTDDISVPGNWSTVTFAHVFTGGINLLGVAPSGKVYFADAGFPGTTVIKRFDLTGSTLTYEADEFTATNQTPANILDTVQNAICNDEGVTIYFTSAGTYSYDYTGTVIDARITNTSTLSHFMAIPTTQYAVIFSLTRLIGGSKYFY